MENNYSTSAKGSFAARVFSLILLLLPVVFGQPLCAADLQPGSFGPKDAETLVCFEDFVQLKQVADLEPAQEGSGNYRYQVTLYGFDANDQPYILKNLGETNNAAEFLAWYNNHWLSGDSVGYFMLGVKVHDNLTDWLDVGELPYTVLSKFNPGSINLPDNDNPNVRDTVYLKHGKVYVSVQSRTLASGGSGVYQYEWLRGVKKIGFEESLKDYKITAPGYVRLRRNVKDSLWCGVTVSKGVYQLKVYPELIPGSIEVENTPGYDGRIYCSLGEAKADTIFATPASGGAGDYRYQWFVKTGETLTEIVGATDCNLPMTLLLNGMTAVPQSQHYTFIRKAKDGTHFTEMTPTDNEQVVHLMQDFNDCIDGYVFQKFGVMLYVDNNPDNHEPVDGHKLHFKSYQWYKDCLAVEGQTDQYYSEDGNELDGIYTVAMTADDGTVYLSCPIELHPAGAPARAASSVIYPVPVDAGAPVRITCEGGKADIYSYTGEMMGHVACPETDVTIKAPDVAGIYYVRITQADGSILTEKLIVK